RTGKPELRIAGRRARGNSKIGDGAGPALLDRTRARTRRAAHLHLAAGRTRPRGSGGAARSAYIRRTRGLARARPEFLEPARSAGSIVPAANLGSRRPLTGGRRR